MSPFLKIQPNPFRFLLYTEWVMLASCASLAVVEALQHRRLSVQYVLFLAMLGLMGLRLPSGKLLVKVLYTGIEIGLIFCGTTLGYLHILPTLYLIVVMRSCFLFELLGRWMVAGLALLLFFAHQVQYVKSLTLSVLPDEQVQIWMHLWAETLVFGLGLFFVLQLVNKLLAERKMRQQIASSHLQLLIYAQKIEDKAAVQERNRIAYDIHDSLGHLLTALNIQLAAAVKLWQIDSAEAQLFLADAQRLGAIAMKEVRQSVSALRVDAQAGHPLEKD